MRQYSAEEAIDIGNKVTGVVTLLVGTAVTFAIGVILIKLLWAWTIPDLFPAAVDQGLIASNMSWLTAIKITVLVAVLAGTGTLVVGRWGMKSSRVLPS